MSDIENKVINNLRENIKTLMSLLEKSKQENKYLLAEKELLAENMQEKDLEIKELTGKYNTLKLAKTISATEDEKKEAKIKINKMVREIDKCIALLNK